MSDLAELDESLVALEGELKKLKWLSSTIADAENVASTVTKAAEKCVKAADGVQKNGAQTIDVIRGSIAKQDDAFRSVATKLEDVIKKLEQSSKQLREVFEIPAKLDTTISGINIAVQNSIMRIDAVERKLADHSKEIVSEIDQLKKSVNIGMSDANSAAGRVKDQLDKGFEGADSAIRNSCQQTLAGISNTDRMLMQIRYTVAGLFAVVIIAVGFALLRR